MDESTERFNSYNFKELFQDCNLNFLIGSGISTPFFGTLGNIENWLTELEADDTLDRTLKNYVKASLYCSYYRVAMRGNLDLFKFRYKGQDYIDNPKKPEDKLISTYIAYKNFLRLLNQILYKRKTNTVNKIVNLFTTNVDIFLERTIEDLDFHYNDGFSGVFTKKFSLSNFRKSCYQKSSHYDNIAEIPVYNLLKIHGSVTWGITDSQLEFKGISLVKSINNILDDYEMLDVIKLNDEHWLSEGANLNLEQIIDAAKSIDELPDVDGFVEKYEKMQVVNPTKQKFKDTTFNKSYYEMLRLYSNELEKETSVLFIMGFSMADEHLRDITFRAIKSNPTLKVFICSYMEDASDIIGNLKKDGLDLDNFHNVELINPFDRFSLKEFNIEVLQPILNSVWE